MVTSLFLTNIYGIQQGWLGSVQGTILIENNVIIGDAGEGMGMSLSGVINATIRNNTVYDCYAGIKVSNHISTLTANHVIDNNTCFDSSLYGIWSNSPFIILENPLIVSSDLTYFPSLPVNSSATKNGWDKKR